MTPCHAAAVSIAAELRARGAELRVLCHGTPLVFRADVGTRYGYVSVNEHGQAKFLGRNPDQPVSTWGPQWARWLAEETP